MKTLISELANAILFNINEWSSLKDKTMLGACTNHVDKRGGGEGVAQMTKHFYNSYLVKVFT